MATSFQISGHAELNAKLSELRTSVQRKVITSAVNAGLVVAARHVRNATPGNLKDARKAIGGRFRKQLDAAQRGVKLAKVGFAVGKSRARQKVLAEQQAAARPKKRGGVGLGARNLHWAILGTGERTHKTTGRKTGRMPVLLDPSPVQIGIRTGDHAIRQAMRKRLGEGLAREIAKLKIGK